MRRTKMATVENREGGRKIRRDYYGYALDARAGNTRLNSQGGLPLEFPLPRSPVDTSLTFGGQLQLDRINARLKRIHERLHVGLLFVHGVPHSSLMLLKPLRHVAGVLIYLALYRGSQRLRIKASSPSTLHGHAITMDHRDIQRHLDDNEVILRLAHGRSHPVLWAHHLEQGW